MLRSRRATKLDDIPPHNKALLILFRGERDNAFVAAAGRRGYQSFELKEEEGILWLVGRALDPGDHEAPSLLSQDKHLLLAQQEATYMVPYLAGGTALACATMEEIHDDFHGDSPASANARYSRYFHAESGSLSYFRQLSASCSKCRRLNGRRGKNVISRMRSIKEEALSEGAQIVVDVAGPYSVFLNPNTVGATVTRAAKRTHRTRVKRWVLLGICYFSHRVEVSELDDMSTGSMITGLAEIQSRNGWQCRNIALDPGSSLLPAVQRTSDHLRQEDDDEGADDDVGQEQEGVSPQAAAALLAGLRDQGMVVRPAFTQASWRQGKIESTIKIFKRCLQASMMPGTSPLTVTSFGRACRLSAEMLNKRPIVLLPSDSSNPDELLTCSPTSLRGPSNCAWMSMAAGRDYTGQASEIHRQQVRFRRAWLIHYSRRLRSNSKMATEGPGWGVGSIVMITDMASPSGRDHPFPRLAKITSWLDDKKSQAELKMSSGVINRPVGSLILLVGADEQVPSTGLMFDPAVAADEEIRQAAGPAELVTAPTGPTAPPAPPAPTGPTAPPAPTPTPTAVATEPQPALRRSSRERKARVRFQ
jgi:hypothetical protein